MKQLYKSRPSHREGVPETPSWDTDPDQKQSPQMGVWEWRAEGFKHALRHVRTLIDGLTLVCDTTC